MKPTYKGTELSAILKRVRSNINHITESDMQVLRFLSEKGDYPDSRAQVVKTEYVPFISEVEIFNRTFGKINNYKPTIPAEKDWKFVYDFILEELEEYKEACEKGDIVEVLDALCDIAYVSIGNGVMLHGLKDQIWPAYLEVQASNMSKACKTVEDAIATVNLRAEQQGEPCHYEMVNNLFIVYRTRDKKIMKSMNYFQPDLKQFING